MSISKNPYKFLCNGEYVCPFCERKFRADYFSKTILGDWKHNSQLAYSNFKKHLEMHSKKEQELKKQITELKKEIRQLNIMLGKHSYYHSLTMDGMQPEEASRECNL